MEFFILYILALFLLFIFSRSCSIFIFAFSIPSIKIALDALLIDRHFAPIGLSNLFDIWSFFRIDMQHLLHQLLELFTNLIFGSIDSVETFPEILGFVGLAHSD